MSQWIFKFGDFEKYHNLKLHGRREQYGCKEPVVWKLYPTEPVVLFSKTFETEGGTVRVTPLGICSIADVDADGAEHKWFAAREKYLEKGRYTLNIRVMNPSAFAAVYVEGAVESDGSWTADDMSQDPQPVGTWAVFDAPEKTPDRFPFAYEPVAYVNKKSVPGGVLFDFGKETFARTVFTVQAPSVRVRFGESTEEAMDDEWAVIQFTKEPENGTIAWEPTAFRYIFVSDETAEVTAEYEYLPLEKKGAFRCDNETLNRIYEMAAYTFHLNSREFFLDGIKRDRWVWGADSYQCLFVNRYLFFDPEIEKRTLTALAGGIPFRRHVNTIVDYTFFWFISLWEYYQTYGDLEFLKLICPNMQDMMRYCRARVDQDGFVRGLKDDWIFIDWAPMDKTGALLGEQVLFAKALECYGKVCDVLGIPDAGCRAQGEALQKKTLEKFYDPEKRVFIDSFESGKRYVTRQNNILAYLFLPLTKAQKQDIYERVILNPEVRPITTPYFTFYENQVHCMQGGKDMPEQAILDYYGAMLETGATTLYEEFDPKMQDAEHYAMYGRPFEKSLCHAWSASPIYLLSAFRMGVKNTGIAYDSFEVKPSLGALSYFEGRVPVPGGYVSVSLKDGLLTVKSDIPGGTLIYGGKQLKLAAGQTVCMKETGEVL